MIKLNNTFYISVEGESEILYLNKLQNLINNGDYAYRVKIICKKNKPTSFVKSTFQGFAEFPYYHICDYEGNSEEDIRKFMHIIDDLKIARTTTQKYELGYSNLCFELWLILHKKQSLRPITNKSEYLSEINSAFEVSIPTFNSIKKESNMRKILDKIELNDIINAINNAKIIENNNKLNHIKKEYKSIQYFSENPSLNLHNLVELILKKCKVTN